MNKPRPIITALLAVMLIVMATLSRTARASAPPVTTRPAHQPASDPVLAEAIRLLYTARETSLRTLTRATADSPGNVDYSRLDAATSIQEKRDARQMLMRWHEEAGQFTRAAEVIAPSAAAFEDSIPPVHAIYDAMCWSMLRRRADAMELHRTNPRALLEARELTAKLRCPRWNHPKVHGREWLKSDEVTRRLIALPDAALETVLDAIGPDVISDDDLAPLIRVVEANGSERDVPILLHKLATLAGQDPGSADSPFASQVGPHWISACRR